MQLRSAAQPPDRQRAEPPLRSVTAGYDVDRWPIAVPIGAEEAIESWLARAASRYAITPRQLFIEADIEARLDRPLQLGRVVREHCDTLAQKLGCEPNEVGTAASEMHPNAAIVDYLIRYRSVSRPVPAGMAFCPSCLADPDPQWKREWASLFGIACTTHSCLLVRTCPRCNEQPFATTSWLSLDPDTPAYRCPNRPRRPSGRIIQSRRCGFDLRSIELFDLNPEAIEAHSLAYQLWQQYVDDPYGLVHIGDIAVTTTIAFDALCQLLDESIRIVSLFEEHFHRAWLVQALQNAVQVLGAPSAAVAAERADTVGLLNPGGPVTPIGPDNVLLRRKRNPLLAAFRLGAVRSSLSPSSQLTFDCGQLHPRYPLRENDDRTWLRLPEHQPEIADLDRGAVPQILWTGTVWGHSAQDGVLPAAAQAMALIKIGDTRSWSAIALDLGLPKGIAVPVTQYWRQVVRAGVWPDALAALTELKEQLRRHPPPIDYQQRRIIADDKGRLLNALSEAGIHEGGLHMERLRAVTARFWERFTGGDIRYAAWTFTLPDRVHDSWPAIRISIDSEYDRRFESAYEWMLTAKALRPSGPLTWHPP
jgi:hypothetical protein